MRRTAFLFWALSFTAACGEYTGPSAPQNLYALARVGVHHLPIPLNGDSPVPLLVADTLRLEGDRPRIEQQTLRQITVIQDGPNGKIGRSEVEYHYQMDKTTLTYDSCPVGAFCAASLVYAPRIFRIVGDSLFELTPVGANIPQRVYGRVR